MQDFSEKLEEEILGQWGRQKPLPDRIYFFKVFRRNLGLMGLGALITGALALVLPMIADNTYKSSVYAIFDHVDVSGSGLGTSPQVRYNTVARLFQARFESQDFLTEIANKLGGRDVFMRENPLIQMMHKVSRGKVDLLAEEPEDKDERVILARVLSKQLDAFPEPESGVLTLSAYSHSPKISQNLANEAMELFIRKELDEQIRSLDIKLNFLQKNITRPSEPRSSARTGSKDTRTSHVNKLQAEDQQTELEDRLRSLNAQLDNTRVDREAAMADVKRELVRLQTTLQPNHPQVVEKRKELDVIASQYTNNESKVRNSLEAIRAQLRSLRSSSALGPDVTNLDIRDSQDYQGGFFVAVSDRIKDIELERKNLTRQRDDPSLRTRLRIIYPAAYEPVPYKNNRRNMALAVMAAGLGVIGLLVILRELRNPRARDVWRVERSTGHSIVAQISLKSANEFSDITPNLADKLRSHLSKINKVDDAARTLLSYRRLELAMEQGCQGRVVMLINAGPFDETAQAIKNFLNIYATDHQDDYLLIDCNLQDPVYRKVGEGPDLVDFWEGRATFEKVMIPREDLEGFAFDVIPPMPKLSGEKTRAFREDRIEMALDKIPGHYKKVFIRAMPESHFIENMALLKVSSDGFVFVDAHHTNYFDLQRTLTHLRSDKLRGLVALGT
ncbi:MAG TPA: hypothetical protein VE954_31385 [Oligoflexus sp.]|uniref:hypothetical protein n=1 Tax=Oligoflexus sp. TaxID=1971216 RepID=UPI002D6DE3E5|nr:hypothetical protein [Oligoflexus sp.]HYX37628.1 hypothetical protein [Oligoflexus sp.]